LSLSFFRSLGPFDRTFSMPTCHDIVQDIRTVVKEEAKYMCSMINKIVAYPGILSFIRSVRKFYAFFWCG
jgi:hypothetical protein